MSAAWTPTRSPSTPWRACSSRRAATAVRCGCGAPRPSCSSSWPSWGFGTFSRIGERQAEEREDVLGVEEEGELADLPVANLEDLQGPRHVAVAVRIGLVLPERRRAVRRDGGDDLRPAAAGARPDPPAEDVLAPAQPQLVWRHRLRRILVD